MCCDAVQDGESNWLLGCMLIASYLILATAFYFCPVDPGENTSTISTSIHKQGFGDD